MENYYTALIIIVGSGIIISVYYLSKSLLTRYRTERSYKNIRNKLYVDERQLVESRLRYVLGLLEAQKIHWVVCHSRNHPEMKIQFIYSAVEQRLQMDVAGEYCRTKLDQDLKDIGGIRYRHTGNMISFLLPVNAKIAADIISFCLYQTTGDDKIFNLSIKTSGV